MSEERKSKKAKGESGHDGTANAATAKLAAKRRAAQAMASRIERIERAADQFAKVAKDFRFKADAASYMDWTVRFTTELSANDLQHVINTDPAEAEQRSTSQRLLDSKEQSAVYHMLARCCNDPASTQTLLVITVALPESQRTGFHAWRALRQHFIGNEQSYLMSLEASFEAFSWEPSESWAGFETRFEALLARLVVAGVRKEQHQKIARLMSAIRQSNRRDAQKESVYTRLNTTNQIKAGDSFDVWMTAMRTEAQKIQDELATRKRPREEESAAEDSERQSVSYVAHGGPGASSSSSFPPHSSGPQLCHNMLYTNQCNYGKTCRFSHNIPAGARSASGGSNFSNNNSNSFSNSSNNNRSNSYGRGGQSNNRGPSSFGGRGGGNFSGGSNELCRDFQKGRCPRRNCRFKHEPAAAASNAGARPIGSQGGGDYKQEAQFAETYCVESNQAVFKEASEQAAAPHRILGDSGASLDLTPRRDFIANLRPLSVPITIRGAFGKTTVATHGGEGRIPVGRSGSVLIVPEMVYCGELRDTLLSLVKLHKRGHTLNFSRDEGIFIDETQTFSIPISMQDNIFSFMLNTPAPPSKAAVAAAAASIATEQAQAATRSRQVSKAAAEETAASEEPPADIARAPAEQPAASTRSSIPAASMHAHVIYGHLCGRKLDQLITNQAAKGLAILQKHPSHKLLIDHCPACLSAKMQRTKFGEHMSHLAEAPNDKAVADVTGPISVQRAQADGTLETVKLYVSMVTDVYSRHVDARVLPDKFPSAHVLEYSQQAKVQTGQQLKHFHTDGGTEYNRAESTLESRGTKVTRTPVHTPQWNAVAERKNRTIVEMARTFLLHAGLEPNDFLVFALEAAVHVHNRVTIVSPHGKTPHELFTGHPPDVSLFQPFGCAVTVRRADADLNPAKMAPRGEPGIFVGYDMKRDLCYRVWVNGRVVVSRDVRFEPERFPARKEDSRSSSHKEDEKMEEKIAKCLSSIPSGSNRRPADEDVPAEPPSPTSSEPNEAERVDARTLKKIAAADKKAARASASIQPTRNSTRARKQTKKDGVDLDDFAVVNKVSSGGSSSNSQSAKPPAPPLPRIRASDVPLPRTLREALRSPYAVFWSAAHAKEIGSIESYGTFVVVDSPGGGTNVVTGKLVFAVKSDAEGFVAAFKVRLVARGFSQQYGVDYTETFSSVVRFKAIRIIYAMCAIRGYSLELMDVNSAYLNAPLKERVFMAIPEGCAGAGTGKVWLLKKAIYGLKQSGREWGQHIADFILSIGFTRCRRDPGVYTRTSRSGKPILLAVYVDDIPGAFDESDRAEWEEIKGQFDRKYSIKFLGEAHWLLNMRITRDRSRKRLWIDQESYICDMLTEFGLEVGRGVDNPAAQDEMLRSGAPSTPEEKATMHKVPFRRAIGELTWLSQTCRPDISHAVNTAAQFSLNPGAVHWRAVLQILRYLRQTAHYALLFDGNMSGSAPAVSTMVGDPNTTVVAFADANWAGCKDTRRSTSGWLVRVFGCPIDWRSHKQATVALSSCESEYMATTEAAQGVMWVHHLLEEIGFFAWLFPGVSPPPVPLILSDNKSAIALAHNDGAHGFSKHIGTKHHFIREQVEAKFVSLQWISTHEQVADIFTKSLPTRIFAKFRDQLVEPLQQQKVEEHKSSHQVAAAIFLSGAAPYTADH